MTEKEVLRLRQQSLDAQETITAERAQLITRFFMPVTRHADYLSRYSGHVLSNTC